MLIHYKPLNCVAGKTVVFQSMLVERVNSLQKYLLNEEIFPEFFLHLSFTK